MNRCILCGGSGVFAAKRLGADLAACRRVPMSEVPVTLARMTPAQAREFCVALIMEAIDGDWSRRSLAMALVAVREKLGGGDVPMTAVRVAQTTEARKAARPRVDWDAMLRLCDLRAPRVGDDVAATELFAGVSCHAQGVRRIVASGRYRYETRDMNRPGKKRGFFVRTQE